MSYLDTERYHSQRMRILARLKLGPAISLDLVAISLRYSSRIHELRQQGHTITVKRTAACGYRYTLERSPSNGHHNGEPAWITEGVRRKRNVQRRNKA